MRGSLGDEIRLLAERSPCKVPENWRLAGKISKTE